MLLFWFVGLLLLRFDNARLPEVLFQFPPGINRDSPAVFCPFIPKQIQPPSTALRKPQLCAWDAWAIHARTEAERSSTLLRPARIRLRIRIPTGFRTLARGCLNSGIPDSSGH